MPEGIRDEEEDGVLCDDDAASTDPDLMASLPPPAPSPLPPASALSDQTTPHSTPTLLPSPYLQGGRKTSSSFSDLGDLDEFTELTYCATPEKPGLFQKPHPIREEMDHFRLDRELPRHNTLHGTGISLYPGEVLKLRVDHAAYIVFYKPSTTSEPESPPEGTTQASSSSSESASDVPMPLFEPAPLSGPPKSFGALGAAGYTVVTGDCFSRYNATRSGSLGRGLVRATTQVGSAFLKGTSTLINQTYEGTARGGVLGFAKGLGLGMWGFGSHTVKGAFRSVGHMTTAVGEVVLGMDPHFSLDGILVLTNYRLVWTSLGASGDTFDIPLASILSIDNTSVTAPHVLHLECKHLLRPQFAFADEETCLAVIEATRRLYNDGPYTFSAVHFNAVLSGTSADPDDATETSAPVYDALTDFARLGLASPEAWTLVNNETYALFPTYPKTFVLPAGFTDEDIVELSTYRSASRVPAVVWLHPLTNASICRCAQPCAGLSGYAAEADKKVVALLRTGGTFHFFDARSQMAAAGNFAQGKGTEDVRNYPNTMLHHCDIANIHGVRASYAALAAVCQPNAPAQVDGLLQRSLWLGHVASILTAAQKMAVILCQGESVMVHCSDGWDRTSQLAGLVEVLLDPYYRTLQGFLELIDKEWCSFGHMFKWRLGVGTGPDAEESTEQSPVFVWRQVPWAFEFSDQLLATIYTHVYSGLFGTFEYNCEKEHRDREALEPTRSLWRYLLRRRDVFENPTYEADKSFRLRGQLLDVEVAEAALRLWDAHVACADPICRKYA
ncbi:myotubularin-like protein [Achlya hypogyna]|uniref:Myotubularin-like protein n=1 Tax=Achlya hypogyna TaxID=1202772 RepID=A0A1V9ZNL1_ACHHY|nr:myotubularin-like protein [Achlya hypogyna]